MINIYAVDKVFPSEKTLNSVTDLSLSISWLNLQQCSNVFEGCGIFFQLCVADSKVVEVVSLVGLVTILNNVDNSQVLMLV